jgi:hypothetical protein
VGNTQLDGSFGLELDGLGALRVSRFAGCLPATVSGRPTNCYFTVRGLPETLTDWLNDTLDGNIHAVRDLIVRGPFATAGGTPLVQFALHDAFVTNASLALDATSSGAGEVNLVVATNSFDQVAPSSGPACDCTNAFSLGDYSFEIEGSGKSGIAEIGELGLSVPRLGSTIYLPGIPSVHGLRVGVSSSSTFGTTRTFFAMWASNVAGGTSDQRDGAVNLLTGTGTTVARIQLANLEPITLFDPLAIGGVHSITLSADSLDFQP